jgi:hypothetical protein
MTNKLFRQIHRESPLRPQALVRNLSCIEQCVGWVKVEPGETGWIPFDMAQRLAIQGVVEIIRFDKIYIDQKAEGKTVEEIDALPGYFCPECAEKGIVSGWPSNQQLQAHRKTHRKKE